MMIHPTPGQHIHGEWVCRGDSAAVIRGGDRTATLGTCLDQLLLGPITPMHSAIQDLPTDLLVNIIALCIADEDLNGYHMRLYELAQVQKWWHNIIHGTPSFWIQKRKWEVSRKARKILQARMHELCEGHRTAPDEGKSDAFRVRETWDPPAAAASREQRLPDYNAHNSCTDVRCRSTSPVTARQFERTVFSIIERKDSGTTEPLPPTHTTIQDLPTELLVDILMASISNERLDVRLYELAQVQKRWHNIIHGTPSFWNLKQKWGIKQRAIKKLEARMRVGGVLVTPPPGKPSIRRQRPVTVLKTRTCSTI